MHSDATTSRIFIPLIDGDFQSELIPYRYRDTYVCEATVGGPDRWLIGPRRDPVSLIMALVEAALGDPVQLLYVLVKSTGKHKVGRYYSRRPLSHADLNVFLTRHGQFLTQDGRHHLWIIDARAPDAFIICDRHDVLYAYGDLERYRSVLHAKGLRAGVVELPGHHAHAYQRQYDGSEVELLTSMDWDHEPLRDGDSE